MGRITKNDRCLIKTIKTENITHKTQYDVIISLRMHIYSGGTEVTVTGHRLDSVTETSINLTVIITMVTTKTTTSSSSLQVLCSYWLFRDVHETFQVETETRPETHRSETETRPRRWTFCPRRDRDRDVEGPRRDRDVSATETLAETYGENH